MRPVHIRSVQRREVRDAATQDIAFDFSDLREDTGIPRCVQRRNRCNTAVAPEKSIRADLDPSIGKLMRKTDAFQSRYPDLNVERGRLRGRNSTILE